VSNKTPAVFVAVTTGVPVRTSAPRLPADTPLRHVCWRSASATAVVTDGGDAVLKQGPRPNGETAGDQGARGDLWGSPTGSWGRYPAMIAEPQITNADFRAVWRADGVKGKTRPEWSSRPGRVEMQERAGMLDKAR